MAGLVCSGRSSTASCTGSAGTDGLRRSRSRFRRTRLERRDRKGEEDVAGEFAEWLWLAKRRAELWPLPMLRVSGKCGMDGGKEREC